MKQVPIIEIVAAWQEYCAALDDWQKLIKGVEPKATGCGPVYELPNPLKRPDESFAVVDMRDMEYAEPHYHPGDVWEFYFVLEGRATVVIGNAEQPLNKGEVVVIPPNTGHFTIPEDECVIAAVMTPPFKPEDYIKLAGPKAGIDYNEALFQKLTKG